MANTITTKSATSSLSSDYTYTTDYPGRIKISRVSVHFDGNYNGKKAYIYLDSAFGSNYDTLLYSKRMTGNDKDLVLFQDIILDAGDQIKISFDSKSGVTAYISITGEHI